MIQNYYIVFITINLSIVLYFINMISIQLNFNDIDWSSLQTTIKINKAKLLICDCQQNSCKIKSDNTMDLSIFFNFFHNWTHIRKWGNIVFKFIHIFVVQHVQFVRVVPQISLLNFNLSTESFHFCDKNYLMHICGTTRTFCTCCTMY